MALSIGELTGYLNLDASKFQGGVTDALGALKSKEWKTAGLAAGAAAAAALAVGFKGAVDLQTANKKISAQLNLSKDEAAKAGKAAGDLYAGNIGKSMEDTNDIIASVMANIDGMRGASKEDLELMSTYAYHFSDTMGTSVSDATQTVGLLLREGMVKDAEEGFDVMARAATIAGPDMVNPVLDATKKFGPRFAEMGLDGEQTMAILAASSKKGSKGIDAAGRSVRRMGDRVTDLNNSGAQDVLGDLGLSGQDLANKMLEGGEGAQEATQTITEALLGVEDPAEQAAMAGKLFGQDLRNIGKENLPEFLEALSGAGEGMEDVEGAMGDMSRTANDTLSDSLETFGRSVQIELVDMMMGAVDWLRDASGGLDNLVKFVKPAVVALGAFGLAMGALNIALAIYNNWLFLTKAASAIATAAQWAWNSALLASPITWIVAGIAALVGALYLFFTKTEAGQVIWEKVWGAIKAAAAAVADWFMNTALPVLQAAWNGIAAGAIWLYENGIRPAWNGIKTAVKAVADWVTGTLVPALQTAWDAIASAAMWLWNNVMQPAWTGIKVAIAVAVTAVMTYIDLLKWNFEKVIAPVAIWLWKKILKPAWDGIKAAIGAVVDWFQNTAWPALKKAWDAVAAAAQWLWKKALKPAWEGIQAAISAVVTWFRDTAWPALKRVIDFIVDAFEFYRDALKAVWSFVKDRVIAPVVNWFRDTVWGRILSPTLEAIKRGFNAMRDSLKSAWNYVKNSVIAPVANWFRDTIKPLFDRATGGIEDAFNTLKSSIKKAWNAIRDTAKTPVKFVVEKIINDAIIGNYNQVADTFGLDTINDVKLPSGWARGGILPGYRPMGAGDDRLTPMRSGEGVLVSEGLRDGESRRAFVGANEAAKRGQSFAEYVQGYAGGGIVLGKPFSGSTPQGDGFGARGGAHKGIDWPLPAGTPLAAVGAGTAQRTYNSAAGNKLNLNVGNGLVAGYHHLSRYAVASGAQVGKGSTVGYVGSTGRSSGPHLHFSLKRGGKYVDPAPYLGAGGEGGEGGGWNPFSNLWESIKSKVADGVGGSPFGKMVGKVPEKLIGGARDWVTDKITALGDWGAEAASGVYNRGRWSGRMTQALGMKGQFGPRRLKWGLDRLMQESGGDPNAINNWDSNAKAGTPSKGLMQVIDPTFRAFAEPGYGSNIFDPLSNMLASINYTLDRYGSLKKGWTRAGGYELGTASASPGWHMVGEAGPEMVRFRGGEQVLTNAETRDALGGQGPAGWTDEMIDRLAERVAEATRSGSREGVAAGLSGSAGRARTNGRMGAL